MIDQRLLPASFHLCVAAVLSLVVGCGGPKGPTRYDLSGSVTYDGKPVPGGCIVFAPDKPRGNDGPGGSAEIKDGAYRTQPGAGTIGGPHIATIDGLDGKPFSEGPVTNLMGRPLFSSVQIPVDLPKQPATHDFAIPRQRSR